MPANAHLKVAWRWEDVCLSVCDNLQIITRQVMHWRFRVTGPDLTCAESEI
jgi:hypothetical protein